MGCFSWKFADTDNKKALKVGERGYLLLPDNHIIETTSYGGYGCFGKNDEFDAYDLVADWNREWLSNHPETLLHIRGMWQRVYTRPWYKYYADLSLSKEQIEKACENDPECSDLCFGENKKFEYRSIGIEIACYDLSNAVLRYPIKVIKKLGCQYDRLPSSNEDPDQGLWRVGNDYYYCKPNESLYSDLATM